MLDNIISVTNTHRFPKITIFIRDFKVTMIILINNDNDLEVFWNWDADSDIESYSIVENGNANTLPAPNPVQPLSYYLDTTINADTASLQIQVASTDSCGLMNVSTIGQTIFLEGSAGSNYQNFIRWSPFVMEYTTVYSYEIYRIVEDVAELIGSVQGNVYTFVDEVSGYDEKDSFFWLIQCI